MYYKCVCIMYVCVRALQKRQPEKNLFFFSDETNVTAVNFSFSFFFLTD